MQQDEMKLDLRKDYKSILKHVKERVRDYSVYVNSGPGEDDDPVSNITLGFAFDQSGWIALVFDTRPGAGSEGEDGAWQSYIEETEQEFQHWFDAVDPIHEATAFGGDAEPLVIALHNGKKVTLKSYDDERIAECIGDMLWQVLVDARDSGLFAKLPLAKQCLMGVSEQDGNYGWPHYKDRVKLGRVNCPPQRLHKSGKGGHL
jgi:hypothetical protein